MAETNAAQAIREEPTNSTICFLAVLTYEAIGDRSQTLALLREAPAAVTADINRWPEVADLHSDSRFLELLGAQR